MRVVNLPGRKWVTCSYGWIVIAASFILLGFSSLVIQLVFLAIDGFDSVGLFIGVVSCGFIVAPWFTRAAVTITSTHLRRAPQNGRPVKVPLDAITHIWPDGVQITSPAGILVEVSQTPFAFRTKYFDDFGPQLAELLGAEWLPHAPITPEVEV